MGKYNFSEYPEKRLKIGYFVFMSSLLTITPFKLNIENNIKIYVARNCERSELSPYLPSIYHKHKPGSEERTVMLAAQSLAKITHIACSPMPSKPEELHFESETEKYLVHMVGSLQRWRLGKGTFSSFLKKKEITVSPAILRELSPGDYKFWLLHR